MVSLADIEKIAARNYVADLGDEMIEEAIRIRLVEETFLDLFSQGRMNGTVHTCVGQEFSAVAVAGQLSDQDWVGSNHRCHGHFISKTKNWRGLVDELMGRKSGVCMGIGSSQHLYAEGFLSNGIQGALAPVATGMALYNKLNGGDGIVTSFIGEGTLGEGALYEAMNLASLYEVPQLFVCENNFYSQSTPQMAAVSGDILDRPKAFGIKTFSANTWHVDELLDVAREAIAYVRTGKPAFLNINTYRLNAHSKGDDDREPGEIAMFRQFDPLSRLLEEPKWADAKAAIQDEIDRHVSAGDDQTLAPEDYCRDQLPRRPLVESEPVSNPKLRMVQALNAAYRQVLDAGAFFIGEDITDPYGGAFKVTKGFSSDYPDQVLGASISESGIIGVSIGMALRGVPSFTEIMFGDFMSLGFDQLLNNASKMHHMYAFQANVPLRVRTPMGGKRGYGPTHSQSLEKFLLGMDNMLVIALSSLLDPALPVSDLDSIDGPAVILENKLDYGKILWQDTPLYTLHREAKPLGACVVSPVTARPTLTIASYGETARHIADNLERFFEETDQIVELVVLTQLHPLDVSLVQHSLSTTKSILVVEDGSVDFGIGAELLSTLLEKKTELTYAKRIGAEPYPIPSVSCLELNNLPTIDVIIRKFMERSTEG